MSDLILRTQIEILDKNLRRLRNFSEFLEGRRSERISKLLNCLRGDESIQASVDNIDAKISEIIKNYEHFLREARFRDKVRELAEDKSYLSQEISRINDYLYDAKDSAEKMQDLTVSLAEGLGKFAGPAFAEKANQLTGVINQIKELIKRKAPEADKRNNKQDAENHRCEAWKKYSEEVQKQSQNLFTEYVDFMRGLAMRDAGLDGGFCHDVDGLVSKWEVSNVTHSFSVPDRYEAVSMTLSRIIRIGFPEWTIWALPLASHEVGHIVVEVNETLKTFVEESADEQSRHSLREILSDAFATYVMGPAYACAAILLRINPLSKVLEEGGHMTAAKRVRAILDMLRSMIQLPGADYENLIQILKKEWEEAMRRAGQPAELKQTDRDQLNKWMAKGIEKVKNTTLGYAEQSHCMAKSLQGQFTEGIVDESMDNRYDSTIVLNAAWIGRTYCPEKADVIEKSASKLLAEIAEARKGDKQAPAGPPRLGV